MPVRPSCLASHGRWLLAEHCGRAPLALGRRLGRRIELVNAGEETRAGISRDHSGARRADGGEPVGLGGVAGARVRTPLAHGARPRGSQEGAPPRSPSTGSAENKSSAGLRTSTRSPPDRSSCYQKTQVTVIVYSSPTSDFRHPTPGGVRSVSASSKWPCEECKAHRTTQISALGLIAMAINTTDQTRAIARLQRRHSSGKASAAPQKSLRGS